MNPLGGLVVILGIVLILMGIFGTQRKVAQGLRKSRPSTAGPTGGGATLQPSGAQPKRPAVIGITA